VQDKINAFWEITKKDLDDRRAELRNKDREMEEMEERHQVHQLQACPRCCHVSCHLHGHVARGHTSQVDSSQVMLILIRIRIYVACRCIN
jgi:hypothetical protein